jgi:NAD(P)H-dependent FMN reductase
MLLRAAAEAMPQGVTVEIASINAIPLYNADEEAEHGIPPPVQQLKDRIAAADGLLIATPEYNNSMPGVVKNAIDWLSRPNSDIPRVFRGLPVGVIGLRPAWAAPSCLRRRGCPCCASLACSRSSKDG